MISVIVPFFNAEKTLHRCVDNILNQTYGDIEILLIDDGSTDSSGEIAETYKADSRVQVFHKDNGGLSSARNNGLNRLKGDLISFIDADDWLEANAFEVVLDTIGEADICGFGRSIDKPKINTTWSPVTKAERIDSEEAIRRLIVTGSIKQAVWDKVFKAELFEGIRFPEGHNYEDFHVTHMLLQKAQWIVLIPSILYHYTQNYRSITHTPSVRNNLDLWMACYELYKEYEGKGIEYKRACVRSCINSIYKVWGSFWQLDNINMRQDLIQQIISFARSHYKEIETNSFHVRIAVYFAATGTRWSMFVAHCMAKISSMLHPDSLY